MPLTDFEHVLSLFNAACSVHYIKISGCFRFCISVSVLMLFHNVAISEALCMKLPTS